MPRENYQRRLDDLRRDVVSMGDLVLDRYDAALDAAETGDADLAREVIRGDHEVNDRYLELEDDCTELLALQQPVAGDLRLITASFKIITDLERVADLATNLAGYGTSETGGVHPAVDLREIGTAAGEMVADAVAAYESADPEACRAVAERDETLDERCRIASESVVRELLAAETARRTTDPSPDSGALEVELDDVSRALLTVRDLERVGDHAVNVAARTLYMIENDDELIY
ncbi:phosphate signaling complex protein PhoU [Halorubrum sp. DTA98]|uniref:phosphate signaling complex protein PhoU n=1 Tax=Halorubrum sp. DTA98 TaxID=3402163 RepID=UPI003AACE84F